MGSVPPSPAGVTLGAFSSAAPGAGMGAASDFGGAPPGGLGAASAFGRTSPGTITPTTDQRLSSIVQRVTGLMNDFQGLKPQIGRLPPQLLEPLAQRGQQLHERFMAMQQRGGAMAGDGTKPMMEADASAYAADMEAFFQDQQIFVQSAKETLAGGSAQGLGVRDTAQPSLGQGFGALPSARPIALDPLSGGAGSSAVGSNGFGVSDEVASAIRCATPGDGSHGQAPGGGLRQLGNIQLDTGVLRA